MLLPAPSWTRIKPSTASQSRGSLLAHGPQVPPPIRPQGAWTRPCPTLAAMADLGMGALGPVFWGLCALCPSLPQGMNTCPLTCPLTSCLVVPCHPE